MSEVWKDIPGYENRYQVSDLGNVRSLSYNGVSGKINLLKPGRNSKGYMSVNLYSSNGSNKSFLVHRLVLLAFVGDSDAQVNHKNGNKEDNRLDNLEFCTASENARHATDVLGFNRGVNNGKSKLTEEQVKEIRQALSKGARQRQLASAYNVTAHAISDIATRETWRWLN